MSFLGTFAKSAALATAGLIAAATAGTASAETFNFAQAGSTTSNTDGNVRTYVGTSGTQVQVSGYAYSPTGANAVSNGYVGWNSYGLTFEHSQNDSSHTIDNNGLKDFLILRFDEVVTVSKLDLYGFNDTDLSYGVATSYAPISLGDKGDLDALFGSYSASLGDAIGGLQSRFVNGVGASGNMFLVAASFTEGSNDEFKLKGITVTTTPAVPEPTTWAMMIGGFGLAGAAMRRRAATAKVRFA
jgi:hypothetical protein